MKKSKTIRYFALILSVIIGLTLISCNNGKKPEMPKDATVEDFSVTFVNVGYGDCAVISGGGYHYMIDTGAVENIYSVVTALNYLDIDRFDGVFLTHSHKDHIGGLNAVKSCAEIGKVFSSAITINDDDGKDKMVEACKNLSLEHSYLEFGDTVPLGDTGAAFLVIGPQKLNTDDENDNSLVLTLNVNGRTLLFTGDMQFAEEDALMNSVAGDILNCDILKVANHGNKDATGESFVSTASPSLAVISTSTEVDKNSASKRVRKLLSTSELFVTENFENGITVKISTDGRITSEPLLSHEEENTTDYSALELSSPSAKTQSFTVSNNGDETVNLKNCFVFIDSGDKIFRFGDYALHGGETVTVSCKGGENEMSDIFWSESFAINTKKEKRAVFYDRFGNFICETRTDISR